jgi:hypothetical protein
MPSSVSFNLINLGGIKVGTHASFSYSPSNAYQPDTHPITLTDLPLPFHDLTETPRPISLLSWHTSLSRFVGRDLEMAALRKWANQPARISTKIISASGGTGKSRLAAEFALTQRKSGWSAGFVDLTKNCTYSASSTGALLIIDYPEEHPNSVQQLLSSLANAEYPNKLRILLLTRRDLRSGKRSFARPDAKT